MTINGNSSGLACGTKIIIYFGMLLFDQRP